MEGYLLKKKTALFFIMASLMVLYASTLIYAESPQASANRAINEAQNSIYSAYTSVAQADQAGGDVSNLVDQLNTAITLLEEAKESYGEEDYSTAYENATEAKNIAETVKSDADDLKARANFTRISQMIIIPIVIVLVAIFGFIFLKRGWKWLERKADEEFLEMEVVITDEEEK
jgi:vacuolar-type H+-ATPase subunit I/STV1